MPGRDTSPQVKRYPISAMIKSPQGDLRSQIHKLTAQGFLAEVPASKVQPGDSVTVSFELSGIPGMISVAGKIVKYYSQWAGGATASGAASNQASGVSAGSSSGSNAASAQTPGGKSAGTPGGTIGHLMEVHFNDLPVSALESISTFLRTGSKIARR